MTDKALRKEFIAMMARCRSEIEMLRKTIEHLEPKAEAYDTIVSLVRTGYPKPTRGESQDLVWTLKRRIAEMEKQEKVENEHTE